MFLSVDLDSKVAGVAEAGVRVVRDQTGRELFVRALERLDAMAREAHPAALRQRRVERRVPMEKK